MTLERQLFGNKWLIMKQQLHAIGKHLLEITPQLSTIEDKLKTNLLS